MPIGSGKYYLDRSYAATFSVQRFTSDPASVPVTYGKQNVEMNGRGGAANAPFEQYVSTTPGNIATYNAPTFEPGNIATYNAPSPGTANYNAPVDGVNVNEYVVTFSFENNSVVGEFNVNNGFQPGSCPSPSTNFVGAEETASNYSCSPTTEPGNIATYNAPSPGNIATYNPPTFTSGNIATYNPPTDNFVYTLGNPGNPTNATVPGYPTRVFPGANPNNTDYTARAATAVYVKLGQEESRGLEGKSNPVSVGTGFGNTNNTFRGYITVAYNAT